MTSLRKRPPPLEPQLPLCGVCGNEVEAGPDGYGCDNCEATWPAGNEGSALGEWEHPGAPQCESIDGRNLPGGVWANRHPVSTLFRCLLHAGHAARYHEFAAPDVHRSWEDCDGATPAQLVQAAAEVTL